MSKKILLTLLVAALLAAGGWFAFRRNSDGEPAVQTQAIRKGNLVIVSAASAKIEADIEVEVKSRASGEVIELRVEAGDTAAAGDLLVRLDPTDEERRLQEAEANLLAARSAQSQAAADLSSARANEVDAAGRAERRRVASEAGIVSGEEARASATAASVAREAALGSRARLESSRTGVTRASLTIEEARKRLRETTIRAPVAGTVLSVAVERGTIISSGMTNVGGGTLLLTIGDLSRLYAVASLDEAEIGMVRTGQRAKIRVDAFPDRPFRGEVERIAPMGVAEANVVTFDVRIRVTDDSAYLLRPGMSADVEIETARHADVLLVPVAALRSEGRDRYVILASGERRHVRTGATDGVHAVLLEGLAEGEEVVVTGGAPGAGGGDAQRRMMWMMRGGGRR